MRTLKLFILLGMLPFVGLKAQEEKLKDVTFSFAVGYSRSFTEVYDYTLSPGNSTLQRQKVSCGAFVISSMLSLKLTRLEVQNNQIQSQKTDSKALFKEKFAINVALNLLEISNSVQFNKSVDAGIGIGYYLQKNAQVALMFEASSVRQIRAEIENSYLGKQIPREGTFYNALDKEDDVIFYNKYVTSISLKIVFSL